MHAVLNWQTETLAGEVHAVSVHLRAEHERLLVLGILVRLHAFEALQGVVQRADTGRQAEVVQRDDAGSTPSGLNVPLDLEHVVGEVLAEHETVVGRLLLWCSHLLNGQVSILCVALCVVL